MDMDSGSFTTTWDYTTLKRAPEPGARACVLLPLGITLLSNKMRLIDAESTVLLPLGITLLSNQ